MHGDNPQRKRDNETGSPSAGSSSFSLDQHRARATWLRPHHEPESPNSMIQRMNEIVNERMTDNSNPENIRQHIYEHEFNDNERAQYDQEQANITKQTAHSSHPQRMSISDSRALASPFPRQKRFHSPDTTSEHGTQSDNSRAIPFSYPGSEGKRRRAGDLASEDSSLHTKQLSKQFETLMTNISDKNQKLVLEYKRHPILTQESRDNILILLNEQKNILKQKLSPNQNPQDIQLKTLEADTKEYEKVANIILNDSSANIIYNQDKMHILEQKERANYTILKDYTKQLRDNLIRINEIKEGPISGWKEELERKINPIKSELLKIQKNIQIHTERDKSINQEKEAAKATISRAEDFHTKLSSTLESHNNALTLLQKQAIIAKLKQINPNYLKPIQDFCRQPRKQEKYSETIIACKTLADHSRSTTNENVIIAASNIIKFLDKKRGDDQTILARQYNHIKDIIHPLTLEDLHQHAKRESDNIAYDIKQKKTIFANHVKISSQLIRDIRSQANHKLGTDEIYKEIFDLCGKVSVGFKFVNNQTRIQWNNKYGYGDISEEQAIDYAIQLKECLEDLNPKENTILGRANDQMDQWHEEAGLE